MLISAITPPDYSSLPMAFKSIQRPCANDAPTRRHLGERLEQAAHVGDPMTIEPISLSPSYSLYGALGSLAIAFQPGKSSVSQPAPTV
jgi:hypothetical protein